MHLTNDKVNLNGKKAARRKHLRDRWKHLLYNIHTEKAVYPTRLVISMDVTLYTSNYNLLLRVTNKTGNIYSARVDKLRPQLSSTY